MAPSDPTIGPDDKDWTWTLLRSFPDCGFAAAQVTGEQVAGWSAAYVAVAGDQWDRAGVRSIGSTFTGLTLGRYGLHDLAHHLWDVGAGSSSRGT